jgi:CheY-like chemotaxis protein
MISQFEAQAVAVQKGEEIDTAWLLNDWNSAPPSSDESITEDNGTQTQKEPKTILIVDDHEALRRAIRTLLFRWGEWKICGEAGTAADAIAKSRELQPDIILLDITLPDFSGLDAAVAIKRERPQTKIVVVSQHDGNLMVTNALASGASAYVTKANLSRDLVPTIRSVLGNRAKGGAPDPEM